MINSLLVLFLTVIISLSSCKVWDGNKWDVGSKIISKQSLNASVSSVVISQNELVVLGSGLETATNLKFKSGTIEYLLPVKSHSNGRITADLLNGMSFGVGSIVSLIISSAEAEVTVPVSFVLQDGAVTASKLASMGASTGQVLKYNGSSWVPANLASSQTYLGLWDADTNSPDISTLGSFSNGDYYIVSVAGTYNLIN